MGLITALVLLYIGAAGGEAAEGMVYLTFVGTQPSSALLTPIMAPQTWWLFVLLSWCLQSSVIGVVVGAAAHFFRWSRLSSGLVLLAFEFLVPWTLLELFRLRAG